MGNPAPDLFISYARIDDQSLVPEHDGWISTFHKALEIRLSQLLGEPLEIWRDPKIQGNDYLDDTIFQALSNTALLISVLSPRYIKSEWCMKELRYFYAAACQENELRTSDNKARLFKVIKTYLPLEYHPSELRSLLGYEFFEIENGRPREFDRTYGLPSQQKFYAKLTDLAYDIYQTLRALESELRSDNREPITTSTTTTVKGSIGRTIYLAETTDDLVDARDNLRRELVMAGHRVLPKTPLPFTQDFSQEVQEDLSKCVMSIHLITAQKHIGDNSSHSDEALQQLLRVRSQEQIQIAEAYCRKEAGFSRILWVPPTTQFSDSDEFFQSLHGQPDFLSTSFGNFENGYF